MEAADNVRIHLCSYLMEQTVPRLGPLFICDDGAVTMDQPNAQRRVLALSLALQSATLRSRIGDRVCTLARTTPEHLEALLAITAAGCIAAPLNWRWTAKEVAYAIDLIGSSILIADVSNLSLVHELFNALGCTRIHTLILLGPSCDDVPQSGATDRQTSLEAFLMSRRRGSSLKKIQMFYAEDLITLYSTRRGSAHGMERSDSWLQSLWRHAPEDASFIIFTSGTSGPPRAALLSHSALDFQCQTKISSCGFRSSDVYLHAAPLFHIGGLCSALAMVSAGATHVFMPTFSAHEAMRLMLMHRVTSIIAVPTMVSDLLAAADINSNNNSENCCSSIVHGDEERIRRIDKVLRLHHLRYILIGAGGLSSGAVEDLARLAPNVTIDSAYGMTEGCSSLTFNTLRIPPYESPLPQPRPPAGVQQGAVYVGTPPRGLELGIFVNYEDEVDYDGLVTPVVASDGVGEVVTRGPHLMTRYYQEERSTTEPTAMAFACSRDTPQKSKYFLPSGWFRTGDLGALQDGHLWLVGRLKDTVKSGGENVAAAEVERVLLEHPGIAAAAVIGLPNERLGEVVAAAVVLRTGWARNGSRFQEIGEVLGAVSGSDRARNMNMIAAESEPLPHGSRRNRPEYSMNNRAKHLDAGTLQRHCRNAKLSGFKHPRVVVFVDSLPTNATGKVVKAKLKDSLQKMKSAIDDLGVSSKL